MCQNGTAGTGRQDDGTRKQNNSRTVKKVVDNIAKKYEKIRRGVDVIMGGKVIETEAKKMYNRGRNEGENKKLKDQIKKKLAKGKGIAQIADEIEESEETVLELIKQIEMEKQTI